MFVVDGNEEAQGDNLTEPVCRIPPTAGLAMKETWLIIPSRSRYICVCCCDTLRATYSAPYPRAADEVRS